MRKKKGKKTPINQQAVDAWHQDTAGILGDTKRSAARGAVLGGKGTRAFFGTERGILGRRRRR